MYEYSKVYYVRKQACLLKEKARVVYIHANHIFSTQSSPILFQRATRAWVGVFVVSVDCHGWR